MAAGEIFLGAPEAGGQASAQVKEFIWTTRRRSLIPSNATGAIPRVPGQWAMATGHVESGVTWPDSSLLRRGDNSFEYIANCLVMISTSSNITTFIDANHMPSRFQACFSFGLGLVIWQSSSVQCLHVQVELLPRAEDPSTYGAGTLLL